MTEEVGMYSVWAMPPPERREEFVKVMNELRSEFGGPSFEPHVTVVGVQKLTKAQACANLEAACRAVAPYTCGLNQVACGTFFYQCIYVLVHPTPEVMQANVLAKRCFGISENPVESYMPHMSLVYGDLSDDEKEKAKVQAQAKFHNLISNKEFQVSSLCLYSTDTEDKSLTSWQKVAECNLKSCSEK